MSVTTDVDGQLRCTPLTAWHAAHGGRIVDFAGWQMPVQYTSIRSEHLATRLHASVFDVSHMGRLYLVGAGVPSLLDRLLTRRCGKMAVGRVRYSLICNADGGTIDDVLVYRLADTPGGEPHFQMVVNASNRTKVLAHLDQLLAADAKREAHVQDCTETTAMIALQGPQAATLLGSAADVASMKYYTSQRGQLFDVETLFSRTGYTGEDGFEIVVPAEQAEQVWTALLDLGQGVGLVPAGLGCRDTLRLEAGMPLYGHELDEQTNPLQAGLGFAVDLDARDFVGQAALSRIAEEADQMCRIGLLLSGKRVPRQGYRIVAAGEEVGQVTSGTFSPTLERPIAMGYVPPQDASVDSELMIDIRGRLEPAEITPLPFYQRST